MLVYVVAVVVGVVVTLSCWLTEQAWTIKNACVRAYKTWLTPIRSDSLKKNSNPIKHGEPHLKLLIDAHNTCCACHGLMLP